ncbi:sugar kinase [Streptomyces sp. LaBMicrA B280]|uniref:sugar kinase n=1 Tax=Streptomyces sp. LaBMicrA B280 TaxID=3391001 RepID=UPI003BA6B55F
MVTFIPTRPGPLADVPTFSRATGGAESNVACAMAALGHSARWVSRVGTDGFGECVVAGIAEYGVDVSTVRRDPSRPTGVYFRTAADRGSGAHEVAYYRAGSAASAMSPANVDMNAVRDCRILHLSGITAALSADCHALLHRLTAPAADRPLISFDINHRPALWRGKNAARTLLELARRADLVFVGEDEAAEVWGVTGGPAAIRRVLREPGALVVKQGARGATAFRRQAPDPFEPTRTTDMPGTFEPSPTVTAVSAIGAGDSFAAGYLSATLRALPPRQRLRHGHLLAAATLTTPTDLAPPPARAHADHLAALDDAAWGRLRLAPGWTQTAWAPEEANTP